MGPPSTEIIEMLPRESTLQNRLHSYPVLDQIGLKVAMELSE